MPESNFTDHNFQGWPLHDAILGRFTLDWEARTCTLELKVFFRNNEDARPAVIEWEDVTAFALSHEESWGSAVSVNRQWRNGDREYVTEMQSGDEILITAGSASLREHHAA